MAMKPPLRLSGKMPKVSIIRTASIAILTKIETMDRPPPCETFSYGNMRPERSIFQPGSRTLLTYPSLELLRPAPLIVS